MTSLARAERAGLTDTSWAAELFLARWPKGLNNLFFFFLFDSIQVQTLEIHIHLNTCPKIMKLVLLDS
jgi:hypothetical protein